MGFLGDHDGVALAAFRVGQAQLDFHSQLFGQRIEAGFQRLQLQVVAPPRGLQRHAELAARDLFLQRLDVGVLFKKEIGDPGDDPGLVPANDGNCGKLLHCHHE